MNIGLHVVAGGLLAYGIILVLRVAFRAKASVPSLASGPVGPKVVATEIVPPGEVVVARGVFSDDDVCELLARDMMRRRGLVGNYRAVFLVAKNRRGFTSQIRVELWRKPEQAESWQDGGQT